MINYKLYTAVGSLIVKSGEDCRYPVITVNRTEYPVDPQEAAVWAVLCWRICNEEQIRERYERFAEDMPVERRTLECCLSRLVTRGLIAKGVGKTKFEALYDLMGDLYVQPVSDKLSYRLMAFARLLMRGVSVGKAVRLFVRDKPNEQETRVMALSRQALMSTAELIKCVEVGATDVSDDMKLLDALYVDEETTCDNIAILMRTAKSREPVTMAVANLYLRKQVILERV